MRSYPYKPFFIAHTYRIRAIFLPLCESFAKVREQGCTQFVFSMDGVGDHANAFRNKVLSNVISKTSKRLSYIYPKKEAAL